MPKAAIPNFGFKIMFEVANIVLLEIKPL